MAKSIAIYSRKSKFTGVGESIENQIELCRQYIEHSYGREEALELQIYEDEGFSGKNTARPQFMHMLQDARKKKFSLIVCYRLDRISRNVGDFAKMIDELNRMEIAFVSIRENFDTSTPMGRAMMYIACVFAQLERETIAERIRDNMYELSKTGRWLGGTTPTGFSSESVEKVSVDNKLHRTCRLKIVREEAQLIALIFDKYLETGSLTKTEAYLMQNHYTTKNQLYFTRFSIRSILSNPVYMIADQAAYQYIIANHMRLYSQEGEFDGVHGIMAYRRTLQQEGTSHKALSREEWIVSVGKHEGLVSGYQWIRVQELLELNQSKAYRKPRSNTALLSGLLFCGSCGSYMRPKLTRRYGEDGERIYEYLCSRKEKSGSKCCNMKNPRGNQLDHALVEELKALQPEESMFLPRLEELSHRLLSQQGDRKEESERLMRQQRDAEKEIASLVSSLAKASGTAAEPYILQRINEYHKRVEGIRASLAKAEDSKGCEELSEEELNKMSRELLRFDYILEIASVEQRRAALRSIIKRAVWDGERLQLYL